MVSLLAFEWDVLERLQPASRSRVWAILPEKAKTLTPRVRLSKIDQRVARDEDWGVPA